MLDYLVNMKQTKDRGKIRAVDHENLILKKKTYYITNYINVVRQIAKLFRSILVYPTCRYSSPLRSGSASQSICSLIKTAAKAVAM